MRLLAAALTAATAVTAVATVPAARAGEPPRIIDAVVMSSLDGTPIATTLFIPAGATPESPTEVVLMGNAPNDTGRIRTPTGLVATLLEAGYAVVTWDTRGSGDSGGEAAFSGAGEIADVTTLLDYVSGMDMIRNVDGDPRAGMVGASYAGGIQLAASAADDRIDVIVPQGAYYDLLGAFRPGGVVRTSWPLIGYTFSAAFTAALGLDSPAGPQTGSLDPHFHQAVAEGLLLDDFRPDTITWFEERSPHTIDAGFGFDRPTLVLHGLNEQLFSLSDGIAIWSRVRSRGAPAKLYAYCGPVPLRPVHACSPAGDLTDRVGRVTVAWFDRYLRGEADADTGAPIEYQTQEGLFRAGRGLGTLRTAGTGSGTVVSALVPTSGTVTAPSASPSPSPVSLRVPLATHPGSTLLGSPRVTGSVSGTGPEIFLFFKLLDVRPDGVAVVVDDQVTARRVPLSASPSALTVDMTAVAWTVQPGHQLVLEVATSSNDHASQRTPAVADLTLTVQLPECRPRGRSSFSC